MIMNDLSRKEREKKTREADIITAAERVFVACGFEDASMDDIAREAEFTKRTIYQYFPGKEDLYFAVVHKEFKHLNEIVMREIENAPTGFKSLRGIALGLYHFYRDYAGAFRIIISWGYVRKQTGKSSQSLVNLQGYTDGIFASIESILCDGIADGSIVSNIKPRENAYQIMFIIIGFLTNLALNGKTFAEHFTLDEERFAISCLDLILMPFSTGKHEVSNE